MNRDHAPYLLLISIDGFRHDYLDNHPTPALNRIIADGVRAKSLRPVWPTLTFPNHYSIATGLYPAEHGIVGNVFPDATLQHWYNYRDRDAVQDGRWYGGEPIWVAAERAGLGSAAFYFIGSEAAVDGVSPTEWRPFDDDVPGATRVGQVLDWLRQPAATRPHVVTLYFEHVDVASHAHGPGSAESIAAIRQVDAWIGQLLDGLDALPFRERINVVVVSDHGQARARRDAGLLVLSDIVDLDDVALVPHGALAMLHLKKPDPLRARELRDRINAAWQHGRAWLPDEAPAYWRVAGGELIADVLLQADPGYVVMRERNGKAKVTAGDHGWSPGFEDMHGIFIASGPRLPAGQAIATIDAVEVYPLMLDMLGLPDRRNSPHPSRLPALLRPAGGGH